MSLFEEFRSHEQQMCERGSGLTKEQMNGAAVAIVWAEKRLMELGQQLTLALTEKSEALRLLEMYVTECKEAQRMLREVLEHQDPPAGCLSDVKSITTSNLAIDACCTQSQPAGEKVSGGPV
jgi:hypothetical protein